MSEFKLNCERFLAATRQHLFSGEPAPGASPESREDDAAVHCGRVEHRGHNCA
ncbi:MAG: hypothetical protein V5B60_21335 [Accumulibacter sp.]|jgi:hypothetical protein|uniref:hypothetical protein n=1 Tax=Accumulibacter sp. TaxID=2053492 RepID=UPI002FC2AFE3